MKRTVIPFSILLICSVILAACAPQGQPQTAPPPAAPTTAGQPPAAPAQPTAAPGQPTEAPAAAPTTAAAAGAHTNVPADMPAGKGIFLGDQSTVSSLDKARALVGDRFTLGKFEWPYNANTMDVYYPFVDIVSAHFYPESMWTYVRINLVGPDANGAFPAKYAVEIDKSLTGRGDHMIIVDHPATKDWSTDGVRVLFDKNGDVGGQTPLNADSAGMNGDGYETVLFDAGQGTDPDMAWARLAPDDPKSVDIAYKTSLLEGKKTYLAGIWAGGDVLDPAKFDLNDHYTHEQAGEAQAAITNFYPIKALFELDNTCRAAIGFVSNGHEPAVCAGQ
jgi:hypothetical protein